MTAPGHSVPDPVEPTATNEMAERTRAFDWARTPVGPLAGWPSALHTVVSIMLGSRYAMWLGWGRELTFFYNDAYARMTLGPKHPWALGRPAREVWPEIWEDIGPRAETVMRTGHATWDEGLLLFLERAGFPEETYHTFSYSPVPDDEGGIGGMLCVVTEDTDRTIAERRLRTLRELAARTTDEARQAEDACVSAARILGANAHDVPFALLYLLDASGRRAKLAGTSGGPARTPLAVDTVDLSDPGAAWPMAHVARTGEAAEIDDLMDRFGPVPGPIWPEPVRRALVLPMAKAGQTKPAGFLVVGVSPRRPLDDTYRGFFDLVAGQIATAIANARAYEEERRRAEKLAELDRAKTAFFSNVSHEFRTPLTLMLGPVEDMLSRSYTELAPAAKGQLEIVNRNGQRLLRLVNSLLDFSRIEAGRVRALFQATDLAAFTTDLASNFRAACERAGLRLDVQCPPLPQPVFVDREMWEKVVLNLLSNAFKFTFDGSITVRLEPLDGAVLLRVEDTGTGIPHEELPRLFERFHRVQNARGRTHEGSGIGLALVQELVRLHGGTVAVESRVGEGSTFTVEVPVGTAHLPPEQIGTAGERPASGTATGASPFLEEALRWLPDPEAPGEEPISAPSRAATATPRDDAADAELPCVLVADDNADMRQYVARLLADQFRVVTVADGEAALAAIREQPPDLVLTDVMMPRLDGFGLLRALREDSATRGLPVIMLSARAGEESRVEGLESGADDYLVKPFGGRELLARVGAHVQMARLRRAASAAIEEERDWLRVTLASIGDAVITTDGEARVTFLNDVAERLTGWTRGEAMGRPLDEVFRIVNERTHVPAENPALRVLREGVVVGLANHTLLVSRDGVLRPIDDSAAPVRDASGQVAGCVLVFRDITERRNAEAKVLAERERFRVMADAAPVLMWLCDAGEKCTWFNKSWLDFVGRPLDAELGDGWIENVHPDDVEACNDARARAFAARRPFTLQYRLRRQDGEYRWMQVHGVPHYSSAGQFAGYIGSCIDVTDQRRAEEALRQSEEHFRTLADRAPAMLWLTGPEGACTYLSQGWYEFTGRTPAQDLGFGWLENIHPDDIDRARETFLDANERREPFSMDYRLRRHDGLYRWATDSAVPWVDAAGTFLGFVGVVTDVHERKEAEVGTRKRSEQVRRLAEILTRIHAAVDVGSVLGVLAEEARRLIDAQHTVASIASDAERGTVSARSVSQSARPGGAELDTDWNGFYRTVAPTDRSVRMNRTQLAEHPVWRTCASSGARPPAGGWLAVPLLARDGRGIGTIQLFDRADGDFTEEDEYVMVQLAQMASVAIENARLVESLRDADRRKDEFLATLAHELRNPLAPLRNGLQVMRLASGHAETMEQARILMERQLGQMVRLVDDLLDVSRISRGKIELRKERVSVVTLVQGAVETSRPVIDQAGHDLAVYLPDEPIFVDADVIRMSQVFANLLNNAAKYTEEGGRIRLAVERSGSEALVSVRDNGLGIPAHMLARVFEMFTQVDHSLGRAQGGLGIGLTLVRRLVEMHGGVVTARSAGPGLGSEFTVRLPVADPAPAEATPHREPAPVPGPDAQRRVLVVDDNRDAASSLATMLEMMGHVTRTAHDGLQAIEAAGDFRPDLVLLDIGMPRMNGYDAARHLRGMPNGKHMVLVALTGWGQEEDRRRTQEAGFDLHLTKPFDPQTLERLLASHLLRRDRS